MSAMAAAPGSGAAGTTLAERSLRRYYLFGSLAVLLMVGGVGGWAALAQISGAVIAPGSVAVEGNTKKVQHLEGGIVAAIKVRNSDSVVAGDVLIRLDDVDVKAQLQITQGQIAELKARQARLLAEQNDAEAFEAAPPAGADTGVRTIWAAQARLFTARREARVGREQQQLERIEQLKQVARGFEAQHAAKDQQIKLIGAELDGLYELEGKQLVTKTRVLALEREKMKLDGESGQFQAELGKTKVQITETRLAITEAKQSFLSEVLAELREIETKLAELGERETAIKSKLRRLTLIAPQGGIVHKLAVHTVGGVIGPGETVMEIVPSEERLVVEAQLDPLFVEQVRTGLPVLLRLTAFDHQVTPELNGMVQYVSADIKQDAPQMPRHYLVRVAINDGELERLHGGKLVPGMPVEVMIKRTDRTVLSYLAKPIVDQLNHAFRER